jgi:glutathione synthase/RimK-type ligase-like ATP-grasp enzyme
LGFWHEIVSTFERLPARCINKPSATNLINNKAVQLLLAGKSGLRVPATVMSNAPAAVREFFDRYPDSAVCKPFVPHIWQRQDSKYTAVAETFPLTREQLPSDEVFTYAPAIYQQRIDKKFDVRTVLMGESIYSFALRTPANSLDWRFDAAINNLDVQSIPTPAEVENGLLTFAQASGVCFGSVDFAVDRHGQWWFLEINEEGQFLWLEQYSTQAALLQKFCAFLAAAEDSGGSLEDRQGLFPSLVDYERAHPNRETMDIRHATADAPFKSVEP